jgi:hypothetical protein
MEQSQPRITFAPATGLINPELPLDQQRHDRVRPLAKIQSLLPRIATIEPAQGLSLLRHGDATRPSGVARRTQRPQAVAASGGHMHQLVYRHTPTRASIDKAGIDQLKSLR